MGKGMDGLVGAQIQVIYWWGGAVPTTLSSGITECLQNLSSTGYYDYLGQYRAGAPTWASSKTLPWTGPNPLDRGNIDDQIRSWIQQGVIAPSTDNQAWITVIFAPPGVELTHDGESSARGNPPFAAYHAKTDNIPNSSLSALFAAVAWPTNLAAPASSTDTTGQYTGQYLDNFTPAMIHEVVEILVDPNLGGNEIGDPCQTGPPMRIGKWRVQKYRSDSDNRCVPGGWFDWQPLGGEILGAPAAISRQPTITNVYVWGMDNKLYANGYVDQQGWTGWQAVDPDNPADSGFKMQSGPFADTMGPDHEQVFAYGTKNGPGDPQVYYKFWTGSTGWGPWSPLGGQIDGRPTARSRQPTITDMFAVGFQDAKLYQQSYVDGSGWLGWNRVDPDNPTDANFRFASAPTADTMGPDHVQLFANGTKGGPDDPQMYQKYWTAAGGWSAWLPLGGKIAGPPTVRSRSSDVCDVFAVGMDCHLYQQSWTAESGWTGWNQVNPDNPYDSNFTMPAYANFIEPGRCVADSMGPGHVQVFAYGSLNRPNDPQVYYKYWTG